jgi:hypothetical protein
MVIRNGRNLKFGNYGTPDLEFKKKHHLGVAPKVNHREYYKRESGGFPQVRAVVSFMSLCMFMD